jgi:hypothetical protein
VSILYAISVSVISDQPAKEQNKEYRTTNTNRPFWAAAAVTAGVLAVAIAIDLLFPPAAIRHVFGSP